jgi:transcriptional regulator with XRE-family HTH domain
MTTISTQKSTTTCSKYGSNVADMATTRGERLRTARERRFKSARVAAKALGIAISTYGAHERAEAPGGRDYGPNEAKRYARWFGVTPEYLLTGRGQPGEPEEPSPPLVRVVGYVGAGAEAHLYEVAQGDLDEVISPYDATEATVAVEIRGDSLGAFFNRWLVFYDDVRRPVTPDLIGELCVVGLEDGRVLVKQVRRGRAEGLFTLFSATEKPIADVAIAWAAKVNSISRRPSRR